MCAASLAAVASSEEVRKFSEPGRAGHYERELQEACGGNGHSCSGCYTAARDVFLSSFQMTK